ncbi:ABC transporter, solute-binding protein [Marvinbryantia formatexigens DSM 14469]|uniref:ABC transporter, solute-binding protein n=1 Tax=Marvinbryantia formatexigens DSM 14469 TaxID=478749 RepID=C6LLM2_9FIRM|nr:ABC transporter substrate-binding protein [Marvinbryantia formatexigens]EET58486.1 ABC transporter, solute-binding protein [Marvinbryantia formatexigens DSM 14469]UWO26792.1 ABC transporter substrate-binding protein [Marvinbryantia formatexigens DSM 14469]SDH16997.1 raffinose/stachyose/melibiose transport system substrate-binding protein [Marvinbryantia formatexigens]
MKKRLAMLGAAAMAVSMLAGMSVNAESVVTEPTELTFIFADGDEGAKASMNEIVNRFNEAYPDITVTIEPGNGGAYSEFIKTKDSVGEFPDVMEMRDTALYVRAGKLAPLPEDIVSLFKTTTDFDGQVYTVPLSGENTNGIIYNKKYFDENGFTEPATYDEFIALCEAIKEKGDMAPLVVGGQDIWHMGFLFHKVYNDQVLSQDPDFIEHCYEGTKDFSDPTFKAALEELQTIMSYAQDGWVSTPDAQITTFLVNDMAAMMYSGTHMFSQIASADPDFEIGWFAVPSPDGKLRLVGGGGASGLAISAEAAQDANKKAAAEEFIRFFYQPENYKVYCETLSAIPATVEQPEMNVMDVFQEVIDATNSADDLAPMWNGRVGNNELPPDFRNFTYKTAIEVLQGTRDIDSACEELNKTWQVSMQSFNPLTGEGIE